MTVSKTILLKDRSALKRLYRDEGEKYISENPYESLADNKFEAAGKAYAANGISEKFSAVVFDGGHSFPDEIRKKAYAFLDEHLGLNC